MPKAPRTIRIVYVPLGLPARVREVECSYNSFMALLGGAFEADQAGDGIDVYFNLNQKDKILPYNGCGVRGPYFFARFNCSPAAGQDGLPLDLSPADCRAILAHVAAFRKVRLRTFPGFQRSPMARIHCWMHHDGN